MDGKRGEVEDAERRLSLLNEQLRHAEQRVANTAEHLVKLNELKNRSLEPLPDSEREDMESRLDSLQQTVGVAQPLAVIAL